MGAKRLGGKRPGGKRLGGETTRGGNDPDSMKVPNNRKVIFCIIRKFNHFSLDIYRVLFILMTYSLKNNGLKIDVFTLRQKGIYPLLETSDITNPSSFKSYPCTIKNSKLKVETSSKCQLLTKGCHLSQFIR